jgi:hypothetical protein
MKKSHRPHTGPTTRAGSRLLRFIFIAGLLGLGIAGNALAKPRMPVIPLPSLGQTFWEAFDQPYDDYGLNASIDTNVWAESWTGYSLNRASAPVRPWTVPMVTTNRCLVDTQRGAVRVWYMPTFDSQSGPGKVAPLLTLVSQSAGSAAVQWSLVISGDGSQVQLVCQTVNGPTVCLSAVAGFQTGKWYLLTFGYTETNTVLFVNDSQVATGGGLQPVPEANAPYTYLVVGSSPTGDAVAQGQFEELGLFSGQPHFRVRPASAYGVDLNWDVGAYYWMLANTAALGPVTPEEEAARREARRNGLSLASRYGMDTSEPPPIPGDGDPGGTNATPEVLAGFSGYAANALWFASIDVDTTNWIANLVLTNTVAETLYEVLSKTNLSSEAWVSETTVIGLDGSTAASVSLGTRTNQVFFWARSWIDQDGNGIPDWWERQYFGTNWIDPYVSVNGDGWTVLDAFQNGWSATNWHIPSAPRGLAVSLNQSNWTPIISWQASSGTVTGYTVGRWDPQTYEYAFTKVGVTNMFLDPAGYTPITNLFGYYDIDYVLQANYAGGDSDWAFAAPSQFSDLPSAFTVPGAAGFVWLRVTHMPTGASSCRLMLLNLDNYPDYQVLTNMDLSTTSGLIALSGAWISGTGYYYVQAVWPDGSFGIPVVCGASPPPFFDGRQHLAQNLAFVLRAASAASPLYFDLGHAGIRVYYPTNYAFAGYANDGWTGSSLGSAGGESVAPGRPLYDNYLYRNFVFSTNDVDAYGAPNTGLQCDDAAGAYLGNVRYAWSGSNNVPGDLPASQTLWIAPHTEPGLVGVSAGSGLFTLQYNVSNSYGLRLLSVMLSQPTSSSQPLFTLLHPGESAPLANPGGYGPQGYFFPQFEQPSLQTVGYYFGGYSEYSEWHNFLRTGPMPGSSAFSPTNVQPIILASAGDRFQMIGYARQMVLNGDRTRPGYLGQYFDKAYKIDASGGVTTNETGILSPYGEFLPTEPGAAALVTMTNWDVNERGTGVVNVIKLQLDVNHDGVMDLSYAGPDNTTTERPFEFWINNDHDYAKMTPIQWYFPEVGRDIPATTNTWDCANGFIDSQRDLEDFARLWICGMPSLTNGGYQVTLSWANVNGGAPAINLFSACETNGGIGYLTDTNTGLAQINQYTSFPGAYSFNGPGLRLGGISQTETFTFPNGFFTNEANKYLLFEGAGIGSGQLVLTVTLNTTNVIAQTGAWMDLRDIQSFYEAAEITNSTGGAMSNWSGVVHTVRRATIYDANETKDFIVLVHGINVDYWHWVNASETVFKRLYWSGFHGRFATVKWPCLLGMQLIDFNSSEFYAYKASTGLKTYLNQLHSGFPDFSLHLLAHSQGNAITSEAIRQGAPFDTYILTEGAISASAYNYLAPFNPDFLTQETFPGLMTPEYQPMGYRGIYTNFTGRIVNFFNTNDPVLGVWNLDQKDNKPEGAAYAQRYGYDGTNCWHFLEGAPPLLVTDAQESRAFVSRSRTPSIGQQGPLTGHTNQGVIGSAVDLHVRFGFDKAFPDDHSAQWAWPIQRTRPYFQEVLRSCQIIFAP